MSIHLTEAVQQNLGFGPLKKIDPNTQQVIVKDGSPDRHNFSQAAIPSILIAFYKYVHTDEGATAFLQNKHSHNWVNPIFGDQSDAAVTAIADYTRDLYDDPNTLMNRIADEVVNIVKQHLPPGADVKDLRKFFGNEKNDILLYLPAELNMGVVLDDETLDDQTNKMEGPISSLVQKIGEAFSTPETVEKK